MCIDLRIYFIREGFQFVHTVCGAIFLYMVSVSVFFFLLWAGLWCVRGRPVGLGVCIKSAGVVCLRRSRGRLPTLPLAQYHRRDQV